MRRALLLIALLPVAAIAQDAAPAERWSQAGGIIEYSCSGGEHLVLEGASNTLKLSGNCGHLDIIGASNVVKAANLDSVAITGASNQVTTRTGPAPRVTKNVGASNSVTATRR